MNKNRNQPKQWISMAQKYGSQSHNLRLKLWIELPIYLKHTHIHTYIWTYAGTETQTIKRIVVNLNGNRMEINFECKCLKIQFKIIEFFYSVFVTPYRQTKPTLVLSHLHLKIYKKIWIRNEPVMNRAL